MHKRLLVTKGMIQMIQKDIKHVNKKKIENNVLVDCVHMCVWVYRLKPVVCACLLSSKQQFDLTLEGG